VKKKPGVLAIRLELLLAGCVAGPADDYTGSAVVQDTLRDSRKPVQVGRYPANWQTDVVSAGRRTTCLGYTKCQAFQLRSGNLVR
jgi:hypothetical protein